MDLCGQSPDAPSPYAVDTLEYLAPWIRIRALFDLGFTRMAVVLLDSGGRATRAGFVECGADEDVVVHLSDPTSDDEQNAVMSPDGRGVRSTCTILADKQKIGFRPVEGGPPLVGREPGDRARPTPDRLG
ncbi:hypothetical protein ACIOHC_38135 [Streptomyces sp. NPDC088252]|uniref:hypothetical protein n=1 Tax=Streptomyces sp. NPDC088252 TaxID=3365845 RepID=UPI00382930DE